MAFTPATGDTSIERPRARKQTRVPRTAPAIPRQPLGRSNLTFSPTNIPRPARTAAPPEIAPVNPSRISGKREPLGNPVGDAISRAAKLLSPLIADAFAPDLLGGRGGGMTSEQHAAFSDMGNITAIPTFAPVFTPAPPFPAFFNEGGFIRKRT